MRWVKLNPQTIAQKAAIIVEHFHDNVADVLEGHAKAMIVADSRKAAVRYKFEVDKYIKVKATNARLTKRPDGSSSSRRGGRSSAVRPIRDLAAYWPHERAEGPATGCGG